MLDYADEDTIKRYRDRFIKWQTGGFKDGDPEFNNILTMLNEIDGVATRYSCASHPERNDDDCYIQFVVSKSGFERLNQLFIVLRNKFFLMDNDKKPKCNAMSFYLSIAIYKSIPIPTAVFRIELYNQDRKKIFLSSFEEVLRETLQVSKTKEPSIVISKY